VPLTIPYSSDFEKVKNIVKEVAHGQARILPNVSRVEKNIISKLFELSSIKILFKDKMDMSIFEPKVLISDISDSKTTLSVRIWIREIDKKDEIISEFLEKLSERFKKENIYKLNSSNALNLIPPVSIIKQKPEKNDG
jgi:small-conductance mechanosensitive channel